MPARQKIHLNDTGGEVSRVDDVTEIVQLIDEHGPQTVCHLLLAFGYASASHDDAPSDDVSSHTQQGDQNER